MATKQTVLNLTELSDNETLSDYQVVEHIAAGNIDSYELIMRRYNQRMYRIARSIVLDDERAMDVVQEAHIKAYLNLHKFQGNSGFAAWLSVITKNEALIMLRKLKVDRSISADHQDLEKLSGSEMNRVEHQPDQQLENSQLRAELNSHIDALPEGFRTVFVMRAIEQLTVRETAQILNLNQATVKTRLFRAKQLLQQNLTTQYRARVYEVGGVHCDTIVANVLARISAA